MTDDRIPAVAPPERLSRAVVLVGLMGSGKSAIGRRLAQRIGLDFADSDAVVVERAGLTIPEIFTSRGESAFRELERDAMRELLDGPPSVLASGGGAFIDPQTRAIVQTRAASVWLRADLDYLVDRCARKNTRPLLAKGNPREILARLMQERYPVYAEADMIVDCAHRPREETAGLVAEMLRDHGVLRPAGEPESGR